MATLVIFLVPLAQLPAERSALYYSFSMMSISESIFSFLDKLSRNIKDSSAAVKLQLILEWHSDVSHPEMNSYSPLFVGIMDCRILCSIIMRTTSTLQCDEMLINQAVFYTSSSFTLYVHIARIYHG